MVEFCSDSEGMLELWLGFLHDLSGFCDFHLLHRVKTAIVKKEEAINCLRKQYEVSISVGSKPACSCCYQYRGGGGGNKKGFNA